MNPAISYPSLEDILWVNEIRRALGQYGLTPSQVQEYAQSAIREMYYPYIQQQTRAMELKESLALQRERLGMEKEAQKSMEATQRMAAIGSLAGLGLTGYLAVKTFPQIFRTAPSTAVTQTALSLPQYEPPGAQQAVSSFVSSVPSWALSGGIAGVGTLLTGGSFREAITTATGAALGAKIGSLLFPGIGTVLGSIVGGIFGRKARCIIVSTLHGEHSEEVKIARKFRDRFLDTDTLRGYYYLSELVVPRMVTDPEYRKEMKMFVDKLIEYGRGVLYGTPVSQEAESVAHSFLSLCRSIGRNLRVFVRSNGEVI